ncbi:type I restriction-modification system subunit M [Deinococcus radiophilus]|uniref:site-specific DNA-methyltransferase (adenine-specific) n=1 Tax=Deinococcus radiophilus TaxID=32062 RepID=A0A3S0I0S6_9DEIO|nr:class I SAM-dependent DNA methyltransferase [Deinococcus radiophilus]RTR20111.1 SAM-dependent DNA methyltransferase [Deinococcus radiophilus]UFA49990.1 type I restriction-modification system subunit M [Deinococcus radiophilus]
MQSPQLSWLTNFIWGIADDVLRDLYVRGKYRDVILPMTVLRRLDAVLEPNREAVREMKASLDEAGITEQDQALRSAAGEAFYNTSPFSLKDLRHRSNQQQLRADFEAYLDGFSPNVQEILENFEFRNQLNKLSRSDALGTLIEKFLAPEINLSPYPVLNGDGSVRLPGLDNHAMGTMFEELVRRFNEDNNEEAGEHWTPRDAVRLMSRLIFDPVAQDVQSGTYLLYDGACGTGGMLTVAEETLKALAEAQGQQVTTHLYGQEINGETYAIAKADMLLKGDGEAADNIVGGPEYSTLSNDAFPSMEFDFMLSNPPYGKSWKTDLERLGGKDGIQDPRFIIEHGGESDYSLITRSSDGQLLFMVNLLSKMIHSTPMGSRIASVHNGSSLFTGDAGQGESNIRRWIIENDWLEAIVALPLNMFYNTGIATYVWVLTNRKPEHRRGKVQLIDATEWYQPLRKNLGKKNCELGPRDTNRVLEAFLSLEESEQSKVFNNADFGYWKVTVERPLRLRVDLTPERLQAFSEACEEAGERNLPKLAGVLAQELGEGPHLNYNTFSGHAERFAKREGFKLTAKHKKLLQNELAQRDEQADPVVKKIHKKAQEDLLHGLYATSAGVVEYESDSELRDTEQIPLTEEGGIAAFIEREVKPYAPDAWVATGSEKIGYEISFTRHFYKPQPLRTLAEITADIRALEAETEHLLDEIVGSV